MDNFKKQPSERFPISANFSYDLEAGDTIASKAVTAVSLPDNTDATATVIDNSSIASPAIIVIVKGGTSGTDYKITVVATTTLGYIYEKDIKMKVVDT